MKNKISTSIRRKNLYDYSDVNQRQETIGFLLEYAAKCRRTTDEYWSKMKRYYDGNHDISKSCGDFCKSNDFPWTPASGTDAYIHVESQINSEVPDFQFNPRDRDDYEKAKQRERIVKYICDNNSLAEKNARSERSLGIYGSSVWKVCWDSMAHFGENKGDVTVLCPEVYEIFPDPSAGDVDSCEYIGYVYKMHKQKAKRVFSGDLKYLGNDIDSLCGRKRMFSSFSNVSTDLYDADEDTVTVTEWWFRQPEDGKALIKRGENSYGCEYKAGDIALSVLIDGVEVRYIPKYWKKTSFSSYPFVISPKIPEEKNIWGKSELSWIIPLIDAKDRELAFAQLNNAYSSNDIILVEENALCDGENLDNSPGAVWKLRPGMMGKIARLGNMAASQNSLYSGALFWQDFIENTTGNYDISRGKEPSGVTTATGIALLGERSDERRSIKNIDRNKGFCRLYSLIDMTALENYSDGRVLRTGAVQEEDLVYRYGGFIKRTRQECYIPSIDVTVTEGRGFEHSRAFTVSALTTLMNMKIDENNYKFVKAYVKTINIPESDRICDFLDEKFDKESDGNISSDELLALIDKTLSEGERENV